jgi:hypothetical protein
MDRVTMPKNKIEPIDVIEIQKRTEELAELMTKPPLKEDEEGMGINIPLFIPDFLYKQLEKEGFISESEYKLTRDYEMNCNNLCKWFSNIDFQFIPISNTPLKKGLENEKLEKFAQFLTLLDKVLSNPKLLCKPEIQKVFPSEKTILIRFHGEEINLDVRNNTDIIIKE